MASVTGEIVSGDKANWWVHSPAQMKVLHQHPVVISLRTGSVLAYSVVLFTRRALSSFFVADELLWIAGEGKSLVRAPEGFVSYRLIAEPVPCQPKTCVRVHRPQYFDSGNSIPLSRRCLWPWATSIEILSICQHEGSQDQGNVCYRLFIIIKWFGSGLVLCSISFMQK